MNRVAIIYDRINLARESCLPASPPSSPRPPCFRSVWSRHIVADSQSIARLFVALCRELHRLRYERPLCRVERERAGEGAERKNRGQMDKETSAMEMRV